MGEFFNFTVLFKFIVWMLCLLFIQHILMPDLKELIRAYVIIVCCLPTLSKSYCITLYCIVYTACNKTKNVQWTFQ